MPICNLRNNVFSIPSLAYIYQFRVIVCTLLTSGFLARSRDVDDQFDSGHFKYVFIDEAACAQSSVALVAIAGSSLDSSFIEFMIFCRIFHIINYYILHRAMHRNACNQKQNHSGR